MLGILKGEKELRFYSEEGRSNHVRCMAEVTNRRPFTRIAQHSLHCLGKRSSKRGSFRPAKPSSDVLLENRMSRLQCNQLSSSMVVLQTLPKNVVDQQSESNSAAVQHRRKNASHLQSLPDKNGSVVPRKLLPKPNKLWKTKQSDFQNGSSNQSKHGRTAMHMFHPANKNILGIENRKRFLIGRAKEFESKAENGKSSKQKDCVTVNKALKNSSPSFSRSDLTSVSEVDVNSNQQEQHPPQGYIEKSTSASSEFKSETVKFRGSASAVGASRRHRILRSYRFLHNKSGLSAADYSAHNDRSKSRSPARTLLSQRPKRKISLRKSDDLAGIPWKEEVALRRALTASMRQRSIGEENAPSADGGETVPNSFPVLSLSVGAGFEDSNDGSVTQMSNCESNSNCSARSLFRANRKFASFSTLSNSPTASWCPDSPQAGTMCNGQFILNLSPSISFTNKQKEAVCKQNASRLRTTEDFLTFLCLRGSSALPNNLEVFASESNHVIDPSTSCPPTPTSVDTDLGLMTVWKAYRNGTTDRRAMPLQHYIYSQANCNPGCLQHQIGGTLYGSVAQGATISSSVLPQNIPGRPSQHTLYSSWTPVSNPAKLTPLPPPVVSLLQSHVSRKLDQTPLKSPAGVTSDARSNPLRGGRRNVEPNGKLDDDAKLQRYRRKLEVDKAERKKRHRADGSKASAVLEKKFSTKNKRLISVATKVKRAALNKRVKGCGPQVVKKSSSSSSPAKRAQLAAAAAAAAVKCASVVVRRLDKKRVDAMSATVSENGGSGGGGVGGRRRSSSASKRTVENGEKSGPRLKCRKSLVFGEASNSSASNGRPNGGLCNAPVYYPTVDEFDDLVKYIETIRADAEPYGMCCIVPPADGWKVECNVPDSLRFVTNMQYIHRLMDRWGPNVIKTACIQRHLEKQSSRAYDSFPMIGGVETDLSGLLAAVESYGGLEQVINKNKWHDVAGLMKLPQMGRDKTNRLYDIYCRHLLPYSSLNADDKQKLETEVINRKKTISSQPVLVKNKSTTLPEYFCAARNTMSMYFDAEPTADQVEAEYWRHLKVRNRHVAVQSAYLSDCDIRQHGGAKFHNKRSSVSRTLSSIQRSSSSLHRYIERDETDLLTPKLEIQMLFSTRCWAANTHSLPVVHYIHTGADVTWYCVSRNEENKLKEAMNRLVSELIESGSLSTWLVPDTVMVPPQDLCDNGDGIQVSRVVQQQGQLVVVFPRSFTASVSCGYNVCEQVNCVTPSSLQYLYDTSRKMFDDSEEEFFSVDELILSIASDTDASVATLSLIEPHLEDLVNRELSARAKLTELGVRRSSKWNVEKLVAPPENCKQYRCQLSHKICHLSVVVNERTETVYCSERAVVCLQRRKNIENYRLFCRLSDKELTDLLSRVKGSTQAKKKQVVDNRRKSS